MKKLNIAYLHASSTSRVEGVHIYGIVNALKMILGHNVILNPESRKIDTQILKRQYPKLRERMPRFVIDIGKIFLNFYRGFSIFRIKDFRKINFIYERYSPFQFIGCLLAMIFKIPYFLELNSTIKLDETRVYPIELLHIAKFIEKKVFKHTDCFFPVSKRFIPELKSFHIPVSKIIVTPNAVDPTLFNPMISKKLIRERYQINDKTVIGFIGTFHLWHGLSALIDVFNNLVLKEPNLHLFLVGDGKIKEQLIRQIKLQNLEKSVTITGYIPHSLAGRYIAAMDIAVLPNTHSFGSPVKLFEYMIMGKAVVAPIYSPVEEIIVNLYNGLLFKPLNVKDLEDALYSVIIDKKLRDKIGKNARSTILRKHTWEINATTIVNQYHKMHES